MGNPSADIDEFIRRYTEVCGKAAPMALVVTAVAALSLGPLSSWIAWASGAAAGFLLFLGFAYDARRGFPWLKWKMGLPREVHWAIAGLWVLSGVIGTLYFLSHPSPRDLADIGCGLVAAYTVLVTCTWLWLRLASRT